MLERKKKVEIVWKLCDEIVIVLCSHPLYVWMWKKLEITLREVKENSHRRHKSVVVLYICSLKVQMYCTP